MHPHTFYSTLYDYNKRDEVFVIMSFAPEFQPRWHQVIEPTIRDNLNLYPNRVDYNQSGEAVVHDILDGIAHARLIVADITSVHMSDSRGTVWPQRNGNVMWELGIAHVMRLPDEIILIRSDSDPSIFDLTQFRAFQYEPSDVAAARAVLLELARDRLKSVAHTKSDYVRKCAEALDPHALHFLIMRAPMDKNPFYIELQNAMQVARLFELGILKAAHFKMVDTTEVEQMRMDVKYSMTQLGLDVQSYVIGRFGIS